MPNEFTAVYYMWKRELIRFFRAKSRVIGSLGMPFFFLAIVGTGLNGVLSIPGFSGNYMEFIAPGILGMVILFGSVFSGITVIMDRQFGFLKETLVAPVSRVSLVLGKSLGGATTAVFQGIIMLAIAMLLGVQVDIAELPLVIFVMALVSVAFVSFGVAMASLMEDMHGFQLVSNLLVMPMFFLSGALFPLDNAPEVVRYLSYANPLTYAVQVLRFAITGQAVASLPVSLGVLVAFTLATTFAATYLFSRIES